MLEKTLSIVLSKKLSLKSDDIDMIITSPPYFNVQTYAWCNWLRLWFLGYDYRSIRKSLSETGSETLYRQFMKESIGEMFRVLKPNGKCFLIVGDIKKKNDGKKITTINIYDFLRETILESGFKIEFVIEDSVPKSKKVFTYLKNEDGVKTERIICMRK